MTKTVLMSRRIIIVNSNYARKIYYSGYGILWPPWVLGLMYNIQSLLCLFDRHTLIWENTNRVSERERDRQRERARLAHTFTKGYSLRSMDSMTCSVHIPSGERDSFNIVYLFIIISYSIVWWSVLWETDSVVNTVWIAPRFSRSFTWAHMDML